MQVYKRIMLVLGLAILAMMASLYLFFSFLLNEFHEIENQTMEREVSLGVNALNSLLNNLEKTTADWSIWDDSYAFIQDLDPGYVQSNLTVSSLSNIQLSLVLFYDQDGQLVYGKHIDLQGNKALPLPPELDQVIPPDSPLLVPGQNQESRSGLVMFSDGPYLLASSPILTSLGYGPRRGTLVMGRPLTVGDLRTQAVDQEAKFDLQRLDAGDLPPAFRRSLDVLSQPGAPAVIVQTPGPDTIVAYTLLKDVTGVPILEVGISHGRQLYQRGQSMLTVILVFLAMIGLGVGLAGSLILKKLLLDRLQRLSWEVRRLGGSLNLTARVTVTGQDELSEVARAINSLLDARQRLQSTLEAGKQEWEATFDAVKDLLLITDAEGRVLRCNQEVSTRLVLPFAAIVGTRVEELFFGRSSERPVRLGDLKGEVQIPALPGWFQIVEYPVRVSNSPIELAYVVRDITERKMAEDALRDHLQFTELISRVSTQIVTLGDRVDDSINYALRHIGNFIQADRSYIFLATDDRQLISNTHEWCAPGIEPAIETMQNIPVDILPMWRDQIQGNHAIIIPSVAAMPPEVSAEKAFLEFQQIRATLMGPLEYQGEAIGLIGFDMCRDEKSWTDEEVTMLQVVGEMIVNALVRKRVQDDLRRQRDFAQQVMSNMGQGLTVTDADNRFEYINPAFSAMCGYTEQEIIGKLPFELTTESQHQTLREQLQERELGQGDTYELMLHRKDGSEIPIQISAAPRNSEDGRYAGAISVITDLTERKQAERLLQESERRYRGLFEDSPVSLWQEDFSTVKYYLDQLKATGVADFTAYFHAHPDELLGCLGLRRVLDVNRATLALYNARTKDDLLYNQAEGFSPESIETFRQELVAIAAGQTEFEAQGKTAKVTREPLDIYLRWSAAPGCENTLSEVIVSIMDITERVRAETDLRESEEKFRALGNSAQDAMILTNYQGQIIYWNPAAERILGYSVEEALNMPLYKLVMKRTLPEHLENIFAGLQQGIVPLKDIILEVETPHKNGSSVPIELSISPVLLRGRWGMLAIARDVSERKKLQSAMIMAQKMADLGTLAAGVAHEINSPLQVITGMSESLAHRLDQNMLTEERLRSSLEILHRNAWRVAEIVRALRTYGYTSAQKYEPNDLNSIIHDTLLLTEHQFSSWSNITITPHLAEGLPLLASDRNQISQVLINLLTNARDAMPGGGQIIIETLYEAATNRIVMRVSDSGEGIPDAVRLKIFDPFFTTKPLGQGTGLGLSIVLGIVRAHGGEIEVHSQPKAGTTFTIYFPLDSTQPPPASEVQNSGRFDER